MSLLLPSPTPGLRFPNDFRNFGLKPLPGPALASSVFLKELCYATHYASWCPSDAISPLVLCMAIYRLLRDTAFDAEITEAMGEAYEALLGDLGLSDRNDPFTEIVAKEIILVASFGVRDPAQIRARVVAVLSKPNPTEAA